MIPHLAHGPYLAHGIAKIAKYSKHHYHLNMDPYKAALESLKSLKLGETPNYTQTAKKYSVDCTGLSRCYRGLQGTCAEKYENNRLLNTIQEQQLVQYI
jgi:hypothetical protein